MSDLKEGALVDKDQSQATITVQLHPLVIMSISDHDTRLTVTNGDKNAPRPIGALLGEQTGRVVDVSGSFELIYTEIDGLFVVDLDFLKSKIEAYNKVFPKAEFLGWYSTGSNIDAKVDVHFHKQFMDFNENPVFLLLDKVAAKSPVQKELPITLFESELRMVNDAPTLLFNKVAYTIETNEAERIAVDHVAHLSSAGGSSEGSQSTAHLASLRNAVLMLRTRLAMLEEFTRLQAAAAAAGEPLDLASLRRVSALCRSLPALATIDFSDQLAASFNDGAMLAYLASMTRTLDSANALIDRHNSISEHGSFRSRMR